MGLSEWGSWQGGFKSTARPGKGDASVQQRVIRITDIWASETQHRGMKFFGSELLGG